MKINLTTKAGLSNFFSKTLRFLGAKNEKGSLKQYLRGGKIPWSNGYAIYRKRYIVDVLSNDHLMKKFNLGEQLPADYGIGIDERCVEIPWLISRLSDNMERLLDAGSALNHDFILNNRSLKEKKVHIMTLATSGNCYCQRGISYLFHDIRSIPIRESFYDTIVCLSTLEHIGCDNTFFTKNNNYNENNPSEFVLVMQEFRRVLKPGGTLFLTVPFGSYKHHMTFQQFDIKLLKHAIDAFGKAHKVNRRFYKYSAAGWDISNEEECSECEYVEWAALPKDKRPHPLPVESDQAAAARAVACIQIFKN